MTRTEAVEKVRRILGFRTDLNDAIIAELKDALNRLHLNATKPWFLIETESPLSTVASQGSVDLPADFIEVYEEGGFQIYNSEEEWWDELVQNDLDELRNTYGSGEGLPEGYALVGEKVFLFPIPDDSYSLKLDYHKRDTELSEGSSTNGYLTHIPELLIGMAGAVVAASVRDKEALKIFAGMEAAARTELYRQNESRKHSNASYQMGGPE